LAQSKEVFMLEKVDSVDDLKTSIQAINVKDYGDFKRKTVLYINRFMERKGLTPANKKILTDMIDKIQFHPTLDIERTRFWAMQQLKNMKDAK
jgi:hypothetical protein